MADGPLNNLRVGAIIQARMKSTRLPGKIILPLPYPKGKPLIVRIIEQARSLDFIDEVVVATSVDDSNQPLEDILKAYRFDVFRGDEDDVLSRFGTITNDKKLDAVIRLTGDNPFLDGELLKKTLIRHIETDADYTKSEGLPIGMNFEILKGSSVIEASKAPDLVDFDKEHVTPYIRRKEKYNLETLVFKFDQDYHEWRTTIDYPADLAFASMVIQAVEGEYIGLEGLVKLISEQTWLKDINEGMYQKASYTDKNEEIVKSIEVLGKLELLHSAKLLKEHLT